MTERVWAASGGNPLLAVEATRAYGEDPHVELASGSAFADRIRGLLAGRLRRVSSVAKSWDSGNRDPAAVNVRDQVYRVRPDIPWRAATTSRREAGWPTRPW